MSRQQNTRYSGQSRRLVTIGHLPAIIVAEEELEPLSDLAETLLDAMPDIGHFLDSELSRARLMPSRSMPRGVVGVGSTVEFEWGPEQRTETLKLVYPSEHKNDGSSVSIASPVGVALLGLRAGQTIAWTGRYGEKVSLCVTRVISVHD
jgi:regulator of nucleoside diphosphate kinase